MTTYVSGAETLIREDLSDLISNLHPAEAPLHTLLEHVPISQRNPEWGIDKFILNRTTAGIASNARLEGAAVTEETATYPEKLQAVAQINSVGVKVSETDRSTDIAGVQDPYEYRLYRAMTQLVNTQEMWLHWGKGRDEFSGASTAREAMGLVYWIAETGAERVHGSASTLTNYYGTNITSEYFATWQDAGGTILGRTLLYDQVLGPAWRNGMQIANSVALMGQRAKTQITEFALSPNGPRNTRNIPAYDKMFVDDLVAIDTPMGIVWLNLDRYMDLPGQSLVVNNTSTLASTTARANVGTANITIPCDEAIAVIMPDKYKIGVLRGAAFRPLASTGDYVFGMVVGEQTLLCGNPLAGAGCSNFFS